MEPAINYVVELNEYSQKNRLQPPVYKEVCSDGPDHMKRFTCRVELNGQSYPEGSGQTKKEAKKAAAKNAYQRLFGEAHQAVSIPNENSDVRVQGERENSFMDTKCLEKLNQHCQKNGLSINFIDVTNNPGPPHDRRFIFKAVIDNQHYPEATAKTKKEAKKMAAQLAWEALQQQTDWDNKVSTTSAASEAGAQSDTTVSSSIQSSNEWQSQSGHASGSVSFRVEEELGICDNNPPKTSMRSPEQPVVAKDADNLNPLQEQERNQQAASAQLTLERFKSEFVSIDWIAKGGFGVVHEVKKILDDQNYALKVVTAKEKALREVKALAKLHHPNIVRYFDSWMERSDVTGQGCRFSNKSTSQYLYILMELCDRKTLRHWINEKNKVNQEATKRMEDSLPIAVQIICGVEYIHNHHLIHRDLKPGNIMFGKDGNVKIGDFGLVTTDYDADNENGMERTITGTKSYMAPEQSETRYDSKVDIYAFGLICFELLWRMSTGHERGTIWNDIRDQKLPLDFKTTFGLEGLLIRSMLSKMPEKRPDARVVKKELEKRKKHVAVGNDKTV